MANFAPKFKRHLFILDPELPPAPLVGILAEVEKQPVSMFVRETTKKFDYEAAAIDIRHVKSDVWKRMTYYAALAAACRLVLNNRPDLKVLQTAIATLQEFHGLKPIATGKTRGKDWHELFATNKDNPILPFGDTERKGRHWTVLVEGLSQGSVTPNHFQFACGQIRGDALTIPAEWLSLADAQLEQLLQSGFVAKNPFGADWDSFRESQHFPKPRESQIELDELGPILRHYCEIVGLPPSRIIERYEKQAKSRDGNGKWHFEGLTTDDRLKELESLFFGKNPKRRYSFPALRPLLDAFDDPDDPTDVPDLMAEWLTAERRRAAVIKLVYQDFLPPAAQHGVGTTYRNAALRLEGFECAFVHLHMSPNSACIRKHKDGAEVWEEFKIDRVTTLLRHFENESAQQVPHSRLHVHPGDELIYMLKGSAFVQLENTGTWTPLLEGDFVHFNSEIPHALWNLTRSYDGRDDDGCAEALIVRFFQLDRHGTRQRQIQNLQHIEMLMSSLGKEYESSGQQRVIFLDALKEDLTNWIEHSKKTYVLWTQLAAWVHDRTRRPQDRLRAKYDDPRSRDNARVQDTARVQDMVGISRYLQTHLLQEYPGQDPIPGTFADLRRALKELQARLREDVDTNALMALVVYHKRLESLAQAAPFGPQMKSQVRACFEGVPPIEGDAPDAAILRIISRSLRLPPVLLDGYLAPPALRFIVVRGAKQSRPAEYSDWVIPPFASAGEGSNKADYKIPARTLANSDMLVTLLTLQRGGHSDWNYHPGFEATITLSGKVRVEFEDPRLKPSDCCGPEGVLVYRSAYSHRLSCEEDAKVLVLRFTVVDSLASMIWKILGGEDVRVADAV